MAEGDDREREHPSDVVRPVFYVVVFPYLCADIMEITVRTERPEDRSRVFGLVKEAFENVRESDRTEHLLVERLRLSDAFIPELSLVAEAAEDGFSALPNGQPASMAVEDCVSDGAIVGHVLMTRVEIVGPDMTWPSLALAPLSVLPACQGQGIGSRLIIEAHRRAAALGHKSVVLLGHETYYPRFGYRRASDFGIRFPFDAPDECCLAAELVSGGLFGVSGIVHYPDAFSLGD